MPLDEAKAKAFALIDGISAGAFGGTREEIRDALWAIEDHAGTGGSEMVAVPSDPRTPPPSLLTAQAMINRMYREALDGLDRFNAVVGVRNELPKPFKVVKFQRYNAFEERTKLYEEAEKS